MSNHSGIEWNAPGGNYQDFFKWRVVFRSFSYNNKMNLKFLFPKNCNFTFLTIRHERVIMIWSLCLLPNVFYVLFWNKPWIMISLLLFFSIFPGGNYQDFLKCGVVFRSFSYNNKTNLRFLFPQNYNFTSPTVNTKE